MNLLILIVLLCFVIRSVLEDVSWPGEREGNEERGSAQSKRGVQQL